MEGLGRNAGPTWGEQVGGEERAGREVWRRAAQGPSVILVISLLGGKQSQWDSLRPRVL